jgi:hypothetical protein
MHKMRRNFLTSWGTVSFTRRSLPSGVSTVVSSVFFLHTSSLHFLRFPFFSVYHITLFHRSLLTILLHFVNLLMLHYDPDTTYSFCSSSTQLQFGPKLLLQSQNLTCLVNLTSSQVYGPIKIPSAKSGSMIHAVRLLLTTGLCQLARGL